MINTALSIQPSISPKFVCHSQRRIQLIMLRWPFSLIFASQVSCGVCYCKRDEVYFITLLWQNNGGQNCLNSLASGWFQGFSEKKHLNARGFAREFLRSGMLYRTGKSLKRRGKSSSLHSKKKFCSGDVGFLWVTSQVEDF